METNQPQPMRAPQPQKNGLAITSLVLGILSILLSLFCLGTGLLAGIPAVICGHKARGRLMRSGNLADAGGMPLAGLICGYVGIGIAVFIAPLMLAIAIPSFVNARSRSQSAMCQNNLRMISGAKDQYSLDHNNATPTAMSDLAPYYIKKEPTCPAGGAYTIGKLDFDPTCTKPGHTI